MSTQYMYATMGDKSVEDVRSFLSVRFYERR